MLWIPLDRTSSVPMIKQISDQIRTLILTGQLTAGSRLPASRTLAADLSVSRNVVLEAYDLLLAEGYIETRPGSGTYVCEGTSLGDIRLPLPPQAPVTHPDMPRNRAIDFRPGLPDLRSFPRQVWGRLVRLAALDTAGETFGYAPPEGIPALRNVLAGYLTRTRGVRCHPDQIVITTGATQALSLAAGLLVSPGTQILLEDPVSQEIRMLFESTHATLVPVPVDDSGMRTDSIPGAIRPRLIYLTPSHQFPMGGTLPVQRRIQLVRLAHEWRSYIIEDDYDSEFRYRGAPVASLQGLAPERVIYVGTFSKILSPGIRLGYAVLPPDLIDSFRRAKRLADLHTSTLEQFALTRFIAEGHLERHIVRMRKRYRKRRDLLVASLRQAFGRRVSLSGESTGLHLVASFVDTVFDDERLARLEQAGVIVYPVERHAVRKGLHLHRIILGYGNLSEQEIVQGLARLKELVIPGMGV